jgi:hypothetical protein
VADWGGEVDTLAVVVAASEAEDVRVAVSCRDAVCDGLLVLAKVLVLLWDSDAERVFGSGTVGDCDKLVVSSIDWVRVPARVTEPEGVPPVMVGDVELVGGLDWVSVAANEEVIVSEGEATGE